MSVPVASETLGDLYRAQGHFDQAADVYAAVLAVEPGRASARTKLLALRPDAVLPADEEPRMSFREHLEHLVQNADGTLFCAVMGFDGIAIDSINTDPEQDVANIIVEYSTLFKQLMANTEMLQTGELQEVSIRSENMVTVARPLSSEYFVALSMKPGGNIGKGRYLLRLAVPKISRELTT